MEKIKEEFICKNKGITLISLVVTIIVLLILAGVSIATLVGDNGILTRANISKKRMEEAEEKEKLQIAVISSQVNDETNLMTISQSSLEKSLKKEFGKDILFQIEDNGDNSFTIQFNDTKRKYYIDNTGEVIENDKILKISTTDELKSFRDEVNSGNTFEGKYIYLTNNITLDINEEWIPIGTYLNENTSIADETNIPFKGEFDGKGHIIDGLKITSQEKGKGLFGFVNNATIKNLTIGENCDINAGISYGSITGYAYLNTVIENCCNKAQINASGTNTGGIVGTASNNCTISKCYNLAEITGVNSVGGIVGANVDNSNVQYCYNLNTINSIDSVGGIVGINYANVKECYNKGDIISEKSNAGGIVGLNYKDVNSCYNTKSITGTGTNIGGIVGLSMGDGTKVSNSYNIGSITAKENNGGGIVGTLQEGTIENSYFLENIVNGGNGTTIEGSTPKTISELKTIHKSLGNLFKKDTNNINAGYPILSWQ